MIIVTIPMVKIEKSLHCIFFMEKKLSSNTISKQFVDRRFYLFPHVITIIIYKETI